MPPETQVQPVPVSPPEAPTGIPGDQPVPEEKRQELLSMIEQAREGIGTVNAMKFAGKNKEQVRKGELLRFVFDKMATMGVDVSDPEAVSEFIERMKVQNPDMAQLFEESLSSLLGDESVAEGLPEESGIPIEGLPPEGLPPQGMAPPEGIPGL